MGKILAQRIAPVMAGSTASGYYAGVGKGGRFPGYGRVAAVARLCRRDMCCWFDLRVQCRIGPAMTVRAGASRPRMVHRCGRKRHKVLVTGITLSSRRDMVGRLAQTMRRSGQTIVAV